ncbi:uncharacterized protein KZ484_011773 isoform 1-T2 [Pholidichthys leucotaenia]
MKIHTIDVPQQNDFNQWEVLNEQQLLNQERNFIVVQVEADCSQIKEEQEDVCISQEGKQFGPKQETETSEDAPQPHDCKEEEEVLTLRQLCKQNSSLDQEEQVAAQVKEEEEELSISKEEEDFRLKQETYTFMVTPTDEDKDSSETEPNSNQLLSHNSLDTESQDWGAGKNINRGSSKHEEPKKKCHRNRSDSNNVDNSPMSEYDCDTDAAENFVKCSVDDKGCKKESQMKKCRTLDMPHVCNTCGKIISHKGNLYRHMKSHMGEKPYYCETCGQRFTLYGNLKIHMRIHTGEKPFSCEICWKNFNRNGTLRTHMRIHTGEKPFSCETCGQSFTRHDNLKTHKRLHTGEKPFSCETCGKCFNQRSNFIRHQRLH